MIPGVYKIINKKLFVYILEKCHSKKWRYTEDIKSLQEQKKYLSPPTKIKVRSTSYSHRPRWWINGLKYKENDFQLRILFADKFSIK